MKATPSTILSCIEISSLNIIKWFYLNTDNIFPLSLFEEFSLDLVKKQEIEATPIIKDINIDWGYFFKSIFLKDEISVLVYMLETGEEFFYLQIKEVMYKYSKYKIEEFFLAKTKFIINKSNKYKYDKYYLLIDLGKINENKFMLIT